MGDRGNIKIVYNSNRNLERKSVFFYGHWSGSEMHLVVQRALQRKQRWNDDAYLARIIFSELTGDAHSSETGFGIAPFILDNEHLIVVVDVDKQEVRFESEDQTVSSSWTFKEYIEQRLPEELG